MHKTNATLLPNAQSSRFVNEISTVFGKRLDIDNKKTQCNLVPMELLHPWKRGCFCPARQVSFRLNVAKQAQLPRSEASIQGAKKKVNGKKWCLTCSNALLSHQFGPIMVTAHMIFMWSTPRAQSYYRGKTDTPSSVDTVSNWGIT